MDVDALSDTAEIMTQIRDDIELEDHPDSISSDDDCTKDTGECQCLWCSRTCHNRRTQLKADYAALLQKYELSYLSRMFLIGFAQRVLFKVLYPWDTRRENECFIIRFRILVVVLFRIEELTRKLDDPSHTRRRFEDGGSLTPVSIGEEGNCMFYFIFSFCFDFIMELSEFKVEFS